MTKVSTIRNQDICAEILLILMACFAPWAYGSVDASAEYVIYGGLFAVIGLRAIADWRVGERSLGSGPLYWALLAIVAVSLLQAVPLSESLIRTISPGTLQTRQFAVSDTLITVRSDPQPSVKAPASTISLDPNETWHGLVRLAAVFLLFDCASRSRLQFSVFKWFAKILVLNSTLLAMFSLIQALSWNGKIFWVREASAMAWGHVGGPFFCHNHLAANLNIGLGLSLGLLFANLDRGWLRNTARLGRFILIYSTGLIAIGVIGSQSRGGVVAMGVSLLAILAMLRMRPKRVLPALAAILAVSIVFLMSIGPSSPVARLGTIAESLTTGLNGRAEVWEGAFQTWKSYPVLGTGFGTFAEAISPNFNPLNQGFYGKFASHAESEYMEMLVEGGLIGLGLLFVVVLDALRKALTTLNQAPKVMRPLILGGLFGLASVTTQSLADFPMHVAGVTVPAVILASKLYRLKLGKEEAEGETEAKGVVAFIRRGGITLKNIGLLAVAGLLIIHQASQVKLEHLVEQARLPLPGTRWVTAEVPSYPRYDLEIMRTALTEALKIRPDWAEGHERLGQILFALYRHAAAESMGIQLVTHEPEIKGNRLDTGLEIEDPKTEDAAAVAEASSRTGSDGKSSNSVTAEKSEEPLSSPKEQETPEEPSASPLQADPLWLHKIIHKVKKTKPEQAEQVVDHEPVKDFLIPAARSFLEARRCCPILAVPHIELAGLDYLLVGDETGLDELKRGIAFRGSQAEVLIIGAQLAIDINKMDIVKECWRDYLRQRSMEWNLIANDMVQVLSPNEVLELAKFGGVKAVFIMGTQLYSSPFQLVYRVRFMESALAELPNDSTLTDEDRIWYEGRIRGELAQYELAKRLMRKSLDLEPFNAARRLEYIETLASWHCYDEAHEVALVGARLFPKNWDFPRLMKSTLKSTYD